MFRISSVIVAVLLVACVVIPMDSELGPATYAEHPANLVRYLRAASAAGEVVKRQDLLLDFGVPGKTLGGERIFIYLEEESEADMVILIPPPFFVRGPVISKTYAVGIEFDDEGQVRRWALESWYFTGFTPNASFEDWIEGEQGTGGALEAVEPLN